MCGQYETNLLFLIYMDNLFHLQLRRVSEIKTNLLHHSLGETNSFVNFENLSVSFDSNLAGYLTPCDCVNVQKILKAIYTYTTCPCIVTRESTINHSNQDR